MGKDDDFGLRRLEFEGSERWLGDMPTGCGHEALGHGSMGRAGRRDWEF